MIADTCEKSVSEEPDSNCVYLYSPDTDNLLVSYWCLLNQLAVIRKVRITMEIVQLKFPLEEMKVWITQQLCKQSSTDVVKQWANLFEWYAPNNIYLNLFPSNTDSWHGN